MIWIVEPTPNGSGVTGGYIYQGEVGARLADEGVGGRIRLRSLAEFRIPANADVLLLDGLWLEREPHQVVRLVQSHPRTWLLLHTWPSEPSQACLRDLAPALSGVISTSETVATAARVALLTRHRTLRIGVAVPGVSDLYFDTAIPLRASKPPRRLLSIGTLHPGKAQRELAEAVAMLLAEYPDLELTLAGDDHVDPTYVAEIRSRLTAPPLRITGALPAPALLNAIDQHDLLVQPTRSESYGMATAEALTRGLPALLTPTGDVALRFLAQHPQSRLPDSSVMTIAATLRRLLADHVVAPPPPIFPGWVITVERLVRSLSESR